MHTNSMKGGDDPTGVCALSSLLSADRLCSVAFCHARCPSLSSPKPLTQPCSSSHTERLHYSMFVSPSPASCQTYIHTHIVHSIYTHYSSLEQCMAALINRYIQLCSLKMTNLETLEYHSLHFLS